MLCMAPHGALSLRQVLQLARCLWPLESGTSANKIASPRRELLRKISRMLSAHIRRHWAIWLAITGMLVMSVAPAVSHAVALYRGVTWLEVCSVQGPTAERAGVAGDAQKSPAAAHLLEHCPYCSTHVPSLDLPPTQAAWVPFLARSDALPASLLPAPARSVVWVHAQPRAPPASA